MPYRRTCPYAIMVVALKCCKLLCAWNMVSCMHARCSRMLQAPSPMDYGFMQWMFVDRSVSREPEIQFKRGKCARGMWRRSSRKRLLRMIVPVKKAKGGNREKRRQARAVCWERPKQGERRARSTSQSRTRNIGTGVYFWGGLEAAVDVCLPACLFQASQMHTWQVEISLHFPSLS